jgi:hypothetical protein
MYHSIDCDDDEDCECGMQEIISVDEYGAVACPACGKSDGTDAIAYYSHHIGNFIIVFRCYRCGWMLDMKNSCFREMIS